MRRAGIVEQVKELTANERGLPPTLCVALRSARATNLGIHDGRRSETLSVGNWSEYRHFQRGGCGADSGPACCRPARNFGECEISVGRHGHGFATRFRRLSRADTTSLRWGKFLASTTESNRSEALRHLRRGISLMHWGCGRCWAGRLCPMTRRWKWQVGIFGTGVRVRGTLERSGDRWPENLRTAGKSAISEAEVWTRRADAQYGHSGLHKAIFWWFWRAQVRRVEYGTGATHLMVYCASTGGYLSGKRTKVGSLRIQRLRESEPRGRRARASGVAVCRGSAAVGGLLEPACESLARSRRRESCAARSAPADGGWCSKCYGEAAALVQ